MRNAAGLRPLKADIVIYRTGTRVQVSHSLLCPMTLVMKWLLPILSHGREGKRDVIYYSQFPSRLFFPILLLGSAELPSLTWRIAGRTDFIQSSLRQKSVWVRIWHEQKLCESWAVAQNYASHCAELLPRVKRGKDGRLYSSKSTVGGMWFPGIAHVRSYSFTYSLNEPQLKSKLNNCLLGTAYHCRISLLRAEWVNIWFF